MKKLIITGAIVCASAFANAASIDWGVGNNTWKLSDGSTAPAMGTTVYLIDGSTALSTIADAVIAGTITDQSWYFADRNTANPLGVVISQPSASDKLTAGTFYDFSVLMVDGDKYMVSNVFNQKAYTPGVDEAMSVSFDDTRLMANALTYDASSAPNGWATAAVPEPTSGLLLLLGMAGLALRRRRA